MNIHLVLPALLAAALPVLAQPAPAHQPSGSYRLVSGLDLTRGIQQATEDLPLFERYYARQRLADVNPLYKTLKLTRTSDGLELVFDRRDPMVLKEGKDVAWTREDGQLFSVSLATHGARFTQTYRGREGQRINAFYVSPAGRTVIMEVTIRSHKLAKVLRYHLVYERVESAAHA